MAECKDINSISGRRRESERRTGGMLAGGLVAFPWEREGRGGKGKGQVDKEGMDESKGKGRVPRNRID